MTKPTKIKVLEEFREKTGQDIFNCCESAWQYDEIEKRLKQFLFKALSQAKAKGYEKGFDKGYETAKGERYWE
uniref:Uncharacterized protein n=1 Tax=viral metagenome TaxID=1070528 RepID=A0A6H1ZEW7_9ZZZZ